MEELEATIKALINTHGADAVLEAFGNACVSCSEDLDALGDTEGSATMLELSKVFIDNEEGD